MPELRPHVDQVDAGCGVQGGRGGEFVKIVPGGVRAYMVMTPEGTFLAEDADEVLIGCDGMDEEFPEPFSTRDLEAMPPGSSIERGPFRAACVMVDGAWLQSLSIREA